LSFDWDLSFDDKGNVVMSRQTLDKILFLASDELPQAEDDQ
jgi:hypothetical protein